MTKHNSKKLGYSSRRSRRRESRLMRWAAGRLWQGAAAFGAILLLGLLVLLLVPPRSDAATTIGVTPGLIKIELDAGEETETVVEVFNESDRDLRNVALYVTDIVIDSRGDTQYVKSEGKLPPVRSPASWVTLRAATKTRVTGAIAYLDIPIGSSQFVKIVVEAPKEARPGDHSAVVFFEVRELTSRGAVVGGRVGARLSIRVKGRHYRRLDLGGFYVSRFVLGEAISYRIILNNDGNLDLKPKVSLGLVDGGGVATQERRFKNLYVMAQSRAELKGAYRPRTGFMPGWRELRLVADYGENKLARENRVFVLPYRFLLAVLGVLLLVGAGVWARVQDRKRLTDTTSEPL